MGTFLSSLSCTKEPTSEREDRLTCGAAYHRVMNGYYSTSTHSIDIWIDPSVQPPVIHLSLRRRPVPETTHEQLLLPNATRTRMPVMRGTHGQRAENDLNTVESPTVEIQTEIHAEEMHTGVPVRRPTSTGTAISMRRILGDVRIRNGVRLSLQSPLSSVQSPIRSSVQSVPMGTIVEGSTWGNHVTARGREH